MNNEQLKTVRIVVIAICLCIFLTQCAVSCFEYKTQSDKAFWQSPAAGVK